MKKNIEVTLNGKTVYGYRGQKILDLCAECGVEVPTLCYDPHLSIHGGCSVCLVEVEGARTLLRACANEIAPGMVIKTDSKRAAGARRTALELLLSDHVGDCRPPCTLACPAEGNVQGYVNLAARGKYGESLDALHHHVTLPSCIGRVCPAPCEKVCRRRFVDEAPVSIREIKRFVGDWGINNDHMGFIPEITDNGKRIAIVGGGPAGVSAAYYLRLKGYRPVIFEKEALLGGMMRYGIPDYRLPQAILQKEIDWLLAHGVEVRTGTALGRDVTLDELRQNFDGVILAMGCWKSSPLRIGGEDLDGVLGGINFLYDVKTNPNVKIGRRVVVVGGGNTAMDACRSARRLGAEEVSVLYRRSREEMPADDIEIVEATEEGVNFIFLAAPVSIEGDGRVERVICERMELGEPDASGRRSPVPTGETFVIEADTVIAAVGQAIDFTDVPEVLHDGRRMIVGRDYDTPLPGVFVCGDQQTGPKIAIEAIGNGHWAAESMDHYLTEGTPKKPFVYDVVRDDLGPADFAHVEKRVQEQVAHVSGADRLAIKFDEYSPGLTEEQTLRDASRCMECGCEDVFECKLRRYAIDHEVKPERVAGEHISKVEEANRYYVRNMDKCILCARCVRACDEISGFHAIDFAKRGFESVMTPHFYRTMEESDCTFCGLCTQVCPVGALIEKRVERRPHLEEPEIVKTTCQLCSVGCELDLNLDRGRSRITRINTDLENPVAPAFGSCCFKGRYLFKDVETAGNFAPAAAGAPVSFEEAAETLDKIAAREGAVYVAGPSLTLQEARALADYAALRTPGAVIAAVEGAEFITLMAEAAKRSELRQASYADLNSADVYLLAETDTDEDQPVLTSWIRRAVRHRGASVVRVGGAEGILDKGNSINISPLPGSGEKALKTLAEAVTALKKTGEADFKGLAEKAGCDAEALEKAARVLAGAKRPVALIGAGAPAEASLDAAAALEGGRYMLLFKGAGTRGLISILPSIKSIAAGKDALAKGEAPGVIFAGITPEGAGFTASNLEGVEYAVLTDLPSPLSEAAHVLIPLLPWTEKEGTVVNLEGRELRINRGPLTEKTGRSICAVLASAALPHGGRIPSNPAAR
ncbi:MAG: FAD-dependent oxidoreductase [Aminivibrio sp.]|jgi:formate dehydrogenase major subunit